MFFSGSKHFLKADHTDEILRLPWPKKTVLWHIQPSWPWSTSAEKNTRFLPSTWGLDTHRHSKTGFRNLRGQLCMIQGFALNGSPGKVLYRIVCWFVGHSSGGCYSDCFHFLSVAAHIKDFVLVSIIVTNWILHFPRTRVTNLQQSECMSVHVHLCVHVCDCVHQNQNNWVKRTVQTKTVRHDSRSCRWSMARLVWWCEMLNHCSHWGTKGSIMERWLF